jgi:hypothetical protein
MKQFIEGDQKPSARVARQMPVVGGNDLWAADNRADRFFVVNSYQAGSEDDYPCTRGEIMNLSSSENTEER